MYGEPSSCLSALDTNNNAEWHVYYTKQPRILSFPLVLLPGELSGVKVVDVVAELVRIRFYPNIVIFFFFVRRPFGGASDLSIGFGYAISRSFNESIIR